ncbi:MAG: DUF924 domain-containing protein [Proteobacteria bacterium]|nr:DUF924 domain-containing protein [Pseudomonadota bacterium]
MTTSVKFVTWFALIDKNESIDMSVKLLSESMDATITDDDQIRIDAILEFWFREKELTAPQIDRRMDVWFGTDEVFDQECKSEFADDVDKASEGQLDHWAHESTGRLALILLLDQFRRNIYRNTAEAFAKDKAALKLCVEGAMEGKDKGLAPIERVFFYMPLQHAESRKVQAKSVALYNRLSELVSATHRETFETIAQFAELHHDIIEQFGRFPHRNKLLNRENTAQENEYLSGDSPDFGQGS